MEILNANPNPNAEVTRSVIAHPTFIKTPRSFKIKAMRFISLVLLLPWEEATQEQVAQVHFVPFINYKKPR
jgi:hypothetical protein